MSIDGLNRFARSMTTKYNGTCEFCAEPTKANHDYASRNNGTWIAVCRTCAISISEQVKGTVRRFQAMPTPAPEVMSMLQTMLPTEAKIIAAQNGTVDETATFDVLLSMLTALDYVKRATAKVDPLVIALQAVITNATATPKDRAVAADMAAAAAKYGRLTDKQASYAKAIVDRYSQVGMAKALEARADQADLVAGGFYMVGADLFKLVKAKAGHLYAMILMTPSTGHKFVWEYTKGGINLVRNKGERITAEQAAAFGKLAHHCVFCNRALTDDGDNKSIEVGYGPVCASKHGLPWG